jgi:hypothetical protein
MAIGDRWKRAIAVTEKAMLIMKARKNVPQDGFSVFASGMTAPSRFSLFGLSPNYP